MLFQTAHHVALPRGIIGFSASDPGWIALNRSTIPEITTLNSEQHMKKNSYQKQSDTQQAASRTGWWRRCWTLGRREGPWVNFSASTSLAWGQAPVLPCWMAKTWIGMCSHTYLKNVWIDSRKHQRKWRGKWGKGEPEIETPDSG